jgi:hypothetical protein
MEGDGMGWDVDVQTGAAGFVGLMGLRYRLFARDCTCNCCVWEPGRQWRESVRETRTRKEKCCIPFATPPIQPFLPRAGRRCCPAAAPALKPHQARKDSTVLQRQETGRAQHYFSPCAMEWDGMASDWTGKEGGWDRTVTKVP